MELNCIFSFLTDNFPRKVNAPTSCTFERGRQSGVRVGECGYFVDNLNALRRQPGLCKKCQNGSVATMRYDLALFMLEAVGEIVK